MAEVRTLDDVQTTINTTDEELELEDEPKVYEVSLHIVPTISPEDVKSEFDSIKKIITDDKESEIISEGMPVLRTLSYKISKTVNAVKSSYSQANFGWIKFTAFPHEIEKLKVALDKQDQIIRYIIISTVRENTMQSNATEKNDDDEVSDQKVESTEHVNEEELDKTIEELVAE